MAFGILLRRVLERASVAVEFAPDLGADETDLTLGTKVVAEEDVALDLDAVGIQGRAGSVDDMAFGILLRRVLERASVAVEFAPDLGTKEIDLAFGAEALAQENAAFDVDAFGFNFSRPSAAEVELHELRMSEVRFLG